MSYGVSFAANAAGLRGLCVRASCVLATKETTAAPVSQGARALSRVGKIGEL